MTYLVTHFEHFNTTRLDRLDYERHLPPLILDGQDVALACRDYLTKCQRKFADLHSLTIDPRDIHALRALMVDHLVGELANHYARELNLEEDKIWGDAAIIAVGGYGRMEMAPFSDIDLLFLKDSQAKSELKELTEKILYLLWDLRLDVGHALRSIDEQIAIMRSDHTVFTAVLDARIIKGSVKVFQNLVRVRDKLIDNKAVRQLMIRAKLDEREERLRRYGGSVYLLEPNLKEGEGGLRDLQLIYWLALLVGMKNSAEACVKAGLIAGDEAEALEFARVYFMRVRAQLHILVGKKNDELGFDWQEKLAIALGYSDVEGGIRAVEAFMQGYYTIAFQTSRIVRKLVRRMLRQKSGIRDFVDRFRDRRIDDDFMIRQGHVAVKDDNLFLRRPMALMEVFEHVQNLDLPLHEETEDLVQRHLHLVTDKFRSDPVISKKFRTMMGNYAGLGRALFAMHGAQFFDSYIPEFRKLRNRVQHDIYHVYTVDTHSIFAVEDVSKLFCGHYDGKFDELKKVLNEIKRPDLLTLGVLFHDIGKGEGGNHSVVGAAIANGITQRLGYSLDEQKIVEFLVLSHLIMPHLSQRRDLEDPALINEMARSMKSLDHLNMLYVLTWADIRAVSSEAWTDWKGTLLENLYIKTKAVMAGQDVSSEGIMRRVDEIRKTIRERLAGRIDVDRLEKFLTSISPRYVYAHTEDEIYEHYHLVTESADPGFMITEKELPGATMSEVLVYTVNNPRTLALVTGVMLALGINIFSLDVFTLTNGYLFLKMHLQAEARTSLSQVRLIERLRQTLIDVFKGDVKVDDLIARRQRPRFMDRPSVQMAKTRVEVDNDVSAYYTVIDVYARDRVGLLYEIIRCLSRYGCYVEVSKISTKVEQVVDTFYIKDIFGHKITSKQKIKDIQGALLKVVDLPNDALWQASGKTMIDF